MPRRSSHEARYRRILDRLRSAREAAGLKQVEVSERLGQSPNFCSRLESGERKVQILDLVDLAALYGKPVSHFLDRA